MRNSTTAMLAAGSAGSAGSAGAPGAPERRERRERRIADARFPRLKRLAEFDLAAAPSINPATLAALEAGAWIAAGEPVVLLGDSGTSKSHLLIGLGVAAYERGLRVRYTTTAGLRQRVRRSRRRANPEPVVARYGRPDLPCLDELDYVHLDPRGAEMLFQVLPEREERPSVAAASNAPFSERGQTFHRSAACGGRRRPPDAKRTSSRGV